MDHGTSEAKMMCRKSAFVVAVATVAAMSVGCDSGGKKEGSGDNPLTAASQARGAKLYDSWFKEKGVTLTDPNPGYALTAGKQTSITATWRCSECHGWDYAGSAGVNGSGSHFTGVTGLQDVPSDPPDETFQIVHDGVPGEGMTAFSPQLSDSDIWDLVKFLTEGVVDLTPYLDGATGAPLAGDPARGKDLFENGLPGADPAHTCAHCHGLDGKKLNFHEPPEAPEYLGTVADNPWMVQHRIRFGVAGEPEMPSFELDMGWTMENVMDVISYVRTLPTE